MEPLTHKQTIAKILTEYGSAIRGDWAELDGRSVRSNLEGIAAWLLGEGSFPTIDRMRKILDLCPKGEGHWIEHCTTDCAQS